MRNYEDIFQAARQAHMEILPEVYAAFGKRNRCCNCLRYKSERGFFHERLHRLWHAFKGLWVFKRSGGLLLEQYQIAAKGVGVLVHTDEGDQRLNEGDSSYLRRAKTRLLKFLFRHSGVS